MVEGTRGSGRRRGKTRVEGCGEDPVCWVNSVCVWVGRTAVCGCDLKKGIRVSSYETFRDYSRCVRARPLQAVKAAVTEKIIKGEEKEEYRIIKRISACRTTLVRLSK